MTPRELQAAHAQMGDTLTGEGLSAEQRGALGGDRNLLELFALGRGVSLRRDIDPPDAITIGHSQLRISKDPAFVREWIERTFLASGSHGRGDRSHAGVDLLADQLERAAAFEDARQQHERAAYAREQVAPELERQVALFQAEQRAFEERFARAAAARLGTMLDESQAVAEAELARYGVTVEQRITRMSLGPGDGPATSRQYVELATPAPRGGDSAEAQAMARAAAELAANQRVMDRMRQRLARLNLDLYLERLRSKAEGSPDDREDDGGPRQDVASLHEQVEALGRLLADAETAHVEAIAHHTERFPLLASYKKQSERRVDVDAAGLDRLQGGGRAAEVYGRIQPVLDAIARTRAGKEDINVWQEPRLLQRTAPAFAIAPGSLHARMIEDKVERDGQGSWAERAIIALAFGLALAAAIPTGGSSLAAGAVAIAEIGGAALDIYLLADQLEKYELDKAKSATDLDAARVISAREPSLIWLAVDIIGCGIGLASASRVFATIADSVAAARTGTLAGEVADVAVARVHRLAREGKLTSEAAERAEREILVGQLDAPAAAIDRRTRVTTERLAELGDRLGVRIEIDGALTDGIELHHAVRTDGGIDPTILRVGPRALVDDILVHRLTVRRITRYNHEVSLLRRLRDRLVVYARGTRNPFPPGTAGYEAFEELAKIEALIASRRSIRMRRQVDPLILDEEIAFLEETRLRHQATVRDAEQTGHHGEPAGHIDSPDRGPGDHQEHLAHPPAEPDLIPTGASPHDRAILTRVLALDDTRAAHLIREYGDELTEYLTYNPLTSLKELEDALARQRTRVKERVHGLYEGIDPAEAPPGWWFSKDEPRAVGNDGTRVMRTEVKGPNGAEGYFVRAYNAHTGELQLRKAFLRLSGEEKALPSVIARQGDSPEMIANKGTPTVQYVTIYQMKKLRVPTGARGAGVRKIHMSDIQNVETIVHLHYMRKTLGRQPADLIAHTASVKYAETTAVQSGYARTGPIVLSGGHERPIGVLLDFQERGNAARIAENDRVLTTHGFDRNTPMLMGFDIDFTVSPAP